MGFSGQDEGARSRGSAEMRPCSEILSVRKTREWPGWRRCRNRVGGAEISAREGGRLSLPLGAAGDGGPDPRVGEPTAGTAILSARGLERRCDEIMPAELEARAACGGGGFVREELTLHFRVRFRQLRID